MTEPTKEQIQALVRAASSQIGDLACWLADLAEALKPWDKEKPARVRKYSFINDDHKNVIEATPKVIARLGTTAGVDRRDIVNAIATGRHLGQQSETTADLIMKHLADTAPDINGEL